MRSWLLVGRGGIVDYWKVWMRSYIFFLNINMAEKKRIIVREINLDICHKIITNIDGTTKIDTPREDTKRTLC